MASFHSVGDSDHADALFSNFAGIGFGSTAQLSVDGHFLQNDGGTESSTNLSTSFRFRRDRIGCGLRFGRKNGADPSLSFVCPTVSLVTCSAMVLWASGTTSDFAAMFSPAVGYPSVLFSKGTCRWSGKPRSTMADSCCDLRQRPPSVAAGSMATGSTKAYPDSGFKAHERFEVGIQYVRDIAQDQQVGLLVPAHRA